MFIVHVIKKNENLDFFITGYLDLELKGRKIKFCLADYLVLRKAKKKIQLRGQIIYIP